jgi:hypothetical protein
MSNEPPRLPTAAFALMLLFAGAHAQESAVKFPTISESETSVLRNLPDWKFTTKAYRDEAVRLMLKDANRVAAQLPLGEHLPIKETDIIERYVPPPGFVCLGWIATTNYNYIFNRKFNALTCRDTANFDNAKATYKWSADRMDTNRVFKIATDLMAAVGMDVAGLNRDFRIEIVQPEKEGFIKKHFFPHFWVNWRNKTGQAVAYIEFIEPAKYILQLRVEDANYILRDTIAIPNLAELLDRTNAPIKP